MKRFKTGEMYVVEIKLTRNPAFHRKIFAFFNFCFEHWNDEGREFMDHKSQYDLFRNKLTIAAGYYTECYDPITGELELKAESLSYDNMEQEYFERCYSAIVNAALDHIFGKCDEDTVNQLLSFF